MTNDEPKRYGLQVGDYPDIKANFHLSGPQNADQVPKEVQDILDNPKIKFVAVVFEGVAGNEKIEIWNLLK